MQGDALLLLLFNINHFREPAERSAKDTLALAEDIDFLGNNVETINASVG